MQFLLHITLFLSFTFGSLVLPRYRPERKLQKVSYSSFLRFR